MTVMIELDNECPDYWVPAASEMEKWLNQAGSSLESRQTPISVSIRVVDETESASLNHRYRGKDRPTNVLSFPCQLPNEVAECLEVLPVGDLAICAPLVESEARQQGKTSESHWAHLLTHGFLHLNGYQHETESEAQAMEAIEIAVLESLGFANPYVVN